MAPRPRLLAFGSAIAVVLAGVLCAVLVGGVAGEVLTFGLIAGGCSAALLLVFLEVGLGEERELERDRERSRRRGRLGSAARRGRWVTRSPRRPR